MAEKCEIWDLACIAKDTAGNVAAGIADDAMGNMAKAIMEGMSQMVTALSTFWVSMPTVNLASEDGTTPSPVVSMVNSELMVWTLTVAVLAVIVGGVRMIWEQRGAPLKDLLRSLITLTLVTGLGLGVISILVIAADAFSTAIIQRSTDGKGFAESMNILVMTGQTGVGVFILIVLGLIGLLASLVQVVLMVVRSGMLVILAGILPTTAAFTNMEMGRQWFQKAVGWTIAFILYKPAAAIVYSVAFLLMGKDSGLIASITGFTLMIVALFALPALMRFVTPMVGAVASGSGGAAGAAVGAIATGAVSLGRSGSGRGNAAPTPATTQNNQPNTPPKGSDGTPGPKGNGGQPTPGVTGPGGSTSTAGTAATATGASKGAAAGPVGVAVLAGTQIASQVSQAAQKTAQDSTGEGPSGSN
jgi:type IV secretion system protein TrbL